jgi:hypothetical protein
MASYATAVTKSFRNLVEKTLKQHSKATLLIAGFSSFLAACGLFEPEPETRACPQVFKMREATRVVQFRDGEGRDLTDVTAEGGIGKIQLACKYDENELSTVVGIEVLAQRGPASVNDNVQLPIFVAVLDRDRKVVAKEVFDSMLEFKDGSRRAAKLEEYESVFRLRSGQSGIDYQLVVGFQLSAEQLRNAQGKN